MQDKIPWRLFYVELFCAQQFKTTNKLTGYVDFCIELCIASVHIL